MSMDGLCLDAADTEANVERFGRPASSRGGGRGGAFPQVRVLGLAECGSHAIIDAAVGSNRQGEQTLADQVLRSLLPGNAGASREREVAELLKDWAESRLREQPPPEGLYEEFLALVEPPLLDAALAAHKGSFAPAAASLGLHRTTLRKKADQYKLGESRE